VGGWLTEPLVGVIRTVRTGGAGDVLVHEAGVTADVEASHTSCLQSKIPFYFPFMQSLERMTVSLARDRLNFTPEQLQSLAEKVRLGDLTPVMQAHEEDIRTPLRSALFSGVYSSKYRKLKWTLTKRCRGLISSSSPKS